MTLPFETRKGQMPPVTAVAANYRPKDRVRSHKHPVGQLIYAVRGVTVVQTASGQWVVPTTRALWVPACMTHSIRMVGHVRMRTIYIRPDASPQLPNDCIVVAVSALLNALILEAVNVRHPYAADSRDGRLMRLLIDEIVQMPGRPLNLAYPSDPRLRVIHERIMAVPDDPRSVAHLIFQGGYSTMTGGFTQG